MKVSINIQPLLHDTKSGVGFYGDGILRALTKSDKANSYTLDFFSYRDRNDKPEKARRYVRDNVQLSICRYFSATLYQYIWKFIPIPYGTFFKEKSDVYCYFNYHIPPFVRGKRIAAVYDMVIKDYPETVRMKTKMMLYLTLKQSIKRADKIVTISEFSKERIMHFYKVPEEKIELIPCGVDRERFRPVNDKKLIDGAKEKYGTGERYFLFLGNLEPRKNLSRLIEAYSLACEREGKENFPNLAVAGVKGWLFDKILEKANAEKDKIILTGYVHDDDVPLLMNGAVAFCFPSIYEGFGMPPLEAMACGTPVLTSNVSSLPEVVGDAGIQVNPYSVEEIAEGLILLNKDLELRKSLSEKGIERSRIFSWEKSANKMLRLFESLSNEKN